MEQSKTRQQIADELKIHRTTLVRKCREAGIELPVRALIPPVLWKMIYRKLGYKEENNDKK